MYGEVKIDENLTLATPTTFALGTVAGENGLKFTVEEDETLVDIEFQGVLRHSVADTQFDGTFIHDGAPVLGDLADLVDGIMSHTSGTVAAHDQWINFKKRMRLAKGEHRIRVAFRSGAGNVIIQGALRPATLSVTRFSHAATLAHGVDSKVQGVY